MSLPFLLEIGTEEIPDWMIKSALEDLRAQFVKLGIPHETVQVDATPRRLVLRATGLAERPGRQRGAGAGPVEERARAGRRGLRAQAGRGARRAGGRDHAPRRILRLPQEGGR